MNENFPMSNLLSDLTFQDLLEYAPIGILIFNGDGVIQFVNNNFFEFPIIKSSASQLTGKNIFNIRLFDEFDINKEINELKNWEPFETELKSIKTISGAEINIIIKGSPVIADETFKGGIIILEDLRTHITKTNSTDFETNVLNNVISNIADYFLIIDSNGEIKHRPVVTGNEKIKSLLSNRFNNISRIFGSENEETIRENLLKAKSNKCNLSFDILYSTREFEYILRISIFPLLISVNEVKTFIVVINDVTMEQTDKQSLAMEIKELRNYHEITKAIFDAVININLDGNIIFWNEPAEKLFGYTKSEVYNKFIGKIIPAIDKSYFKFLLEDLNENKTWKSEIWTDPEKNRGDLLSIRMALIEQEEKYIVVLCSSITERAKLEKELRQSEERFRNIVTNTREYICTFDLEGKLTYVNPFLVKEFGYSQEELLLMNIYDLIDRELLDSGVGSKSRFFEEQSDSLELTLRKRNGSKIYALANFTAVTQLDGKAQHFNAVFTDITEKKEAEKDLLMIRSVFEASQDGIAIQTKRKYILVNDTFVNMFGYSSTEEIIGKDPLDFVDEDDYGKVANFIQANEQGINTERRYNFAAVRKDGTKFYVEKSVSSYNTKDGLFIVSTFRDITKEKKALEDLELSEEKYRSITENINDCVWSAEFKNGKLDNMFYSDAIKKITGYPSGNFVKDKRLWLRIIHPNDVQRIVSRLRGIYKDSIRTSDELEYRVINELGNVVWIKNKINLLRNDKGKLQKIFGLVSDVSLSKRGEEELRKSAQELKTLNEAKDRFISIISHDLRTPFSSILGFTDMLLSDRNMPESKQIQYISFIQESAKNMLSLVNSLLDWTRLQTGRINFVPQRINARYVINKSIQMLTGAAIQKNINLVSDIVNDVYIHADENLLLQVFNNLISNAIKFTKQRGSITIFATPLLRKKQFQFSVKDSGVGIKEDDLSKLFKVDTKHTTPGTSGEKGSGLGLSLCYDIVKKHGGDISVRSELGKGTEIIFTMPVSSTKILLVDDSRTDRILYSKLLKTFVPDYTVEEASNGKEAYDKIRELSPALVITDHKMPIMSGYSLVQQLNLSDLKFKPPVIVLSSDLNEAIINDYKNLGIDFAFKKPVNLTTFKFAVDKSLKKLVTS